MKGIILEVNNRTLTELLHLPEDAVIDDIQREINMMDDIWLIRVRGAGPYVSQGDMLQRVRGKITLNKEVVTVSHSIDWGMQ